MGLFSKISFKGIGKSIGKAAKSVTRQISIKNAVKLGDVATGGQLSNAVGLIGHLTGKAQEQAQQGNTETAVSIAENANQIKEAALRVGGNPTIKELAQAGAGGALTAVGIRLAGSTTAGQIGADLADSTMEAWFKKNWLKVVGGAAGIMVVFKMLSGSSGSRGRLK